MKKLLAILVLGLFLSNASPAAEFDANKISITWWDRIVWFFEDIFESDKDEEIKQLKNEIYQLKMKKEDKSKSILDAIKSLEMQLILLDD